MNSRRLMLTIGAIVVSAGLAVGLVAGVTWEEPGLVISYFLGDSQDVVWRDTADAELPAAASASLNAVYASSKRPSSYARTPSANVLPRKSSRTSRGSISGRNTLIVLSGRSGRTPISRA